MSIFLKIPWLEYGLGILCTFNLRVYQAEEKNSLLETGSQYTPSAIVVMDVIISFINLQPFSLCPYVLCVFQLENLMYYTENNHNKVVLRDFYLSRFENGSITEPCGTPEYLGTYINQQMCAGWYWVPEYVLCLSSWLCFSFLPAPEVVARHRYGRPVDCWAIGVIMYML